jgi:hypothetical protein
MNTIYVDDSLVNARHNIKEIVRMQFVFCLLISIYPGNPAELKL